jgi:hypothetical protein
MKEKTSYSSWKRRSNELSKRLSMMLMAMVMLLERLDLMVMSVILAMAPIEGIVVAIVVKSEIMNVEREEKEGKVTGLDPEDVVIQSRKEMTT